jgi:hypothetical protein
VAFLRFSRDKRGYEHFYLVEATTNRRGKTRARVLYWFRTPPNVKVGREPFDDDVRRALESQNPGIAFDWRKIAETPIPSAEADRWRERRRAEKAERAARRVELPDENLDIAEMPDAETPDADTPDADAPDLTLDAAEQQADALEPTEESLVATAATIDPRTTPMVAVAEPSAHRRRRRRRRRRSSQGAPPDPGKPPDT